MKNYLILIAGLLITTALFAEMAEQPVDNFNDGTMENELGSSWIFFSDAENQGQTEGSLTVNSGMLHAQWHLDQGKWEWKPYFILGR